MSDSEEYCSHRHGIASPFIVRQELIEFLGLPKGVWLSRVAAVHLICNYIKANKLKNGKFIEPDERLTKLLWASGIPFPAELTFFTLHRHLNPFFVSRSEALEKCAIFVQSLYRGKVACREVDLKRLEPQHLLCGEYRDVRLARFGMSDTVARMS